jgi:hypothetical protein
MADFALLPLRLLVGLISVRSYFVHFFDAPLYLFSFLWSHSLHSYSLIILFFFSSSSVPIYVHSFLSVSFIFLYHPMSVWPYGQTGQRWEQTEVWRIWARECTGILVITGLLRNWVRSVADSQCDQLKQNNFIKQTRDPLCGLVVTLPRY